MPHKELLSIIGIIIYFAILLSVVLKAKKSNNLEEYFLGNRQFNFWMIAITFIASWWGAGSALATADQAFTEGISSFWIYGMPVLFSTLLIGVMAKAIRRLPALTQSKILEMRYGHIPAFLLTLTILLFMTITAASQMVGVGQFFQGYLQMDYLWGVLLGSGVVLIYSLFGGFRAVVITDIVQFIFLAIASLTLFGVAWYHIDGWDAIKEKAFSTENLNYIDFGANLSQNMVYVITFGAAWMIQANVWQRVSASRNAQDAQNMAKVSFVAYFILYGITVLTGMAASLLFDTLPTGGVIPALIDRYMSPIVGLLIFIGICSAIMSTMDSLINTGALVLTNDIYRRYINPKANDKKLVYISVLATFLVTVVALIIALQIRSILEVSWIAADILATGCFVPLVLGFIWRRGTTKGALFSMIFGLSYSLYFLAKQLGANLYVPFEQGSTQQVLVGMGCSFIIYISVSLLSKPEYEKADEFIRLTKENV